MLDKKTSKVYKQLITTEDPYKRFSIVERLDSSAAKRVLLALVMNKKEEIHLD